MLASSLTTRAWGRKLGIALLANVGIFLVVESGLRALGITFEVPPLRWHFANRWQLGDIHPQDVPIRSHDELFWDLDPGAVMGWGGDVINAHAMRGPEVPLERGSGTYRIAFLGDSCTFGVGVTVEQTFGMRLARRLEGLRPDLEVEVVNAGVPGYSIFQGVGKFRLAVQAFEPDLLVLDFGVWNDFNVAMGWSDRELGLGAHERSGFLRRAHRGLRRLRVVQAVESRLGEWLRRRHWKQAVHEWQEGDPSTGYRVSTDEFAAHLFELLDWCSKHDADAILVLPQLNRSERKNLELSFDRLDRYRAETEQAAGYWGWPTVDQKEIFSAAPHDRLFSDFVHPNALGHLWIGLALADVVEERGWLDDVPRASGTPDRAGARLRCAESSIPVAHRPRLHLVLDAGSALSAEQGATLAISASPMPCRWRESPPSEPLLRDRTSSLFPLPTQHVDGDGRVVFEVIVPDELFDSPGVPAVGFAARIADDDGEGVWSNDLWLPIRR